MAVACAISLVVSSFLNVGEVAVRALVREFGVRAGGGTVSVHAEIQCHLEGRWPLLQSRLTLLGTFRWFHSAQHQCCCCSEQQHTQHLSLQGG